MNKKEKKELIHRCNKIMEKVLDGHELSDEDFIDLIELDDERDKDIIKLMN